MTGTRLNLLASTHTNWESWKKKYPHTRVLSDQTGFKRLYNRDPYQGYESSSRLMFDVNLKDSKYHPKEKFIGIVFGGKAKAKAYAFSELSRSRSPVKDIFNKVPIQIYFDRRTQTAVIRDEKNKELPAVVGFWFAWYAFHPTTKIFVGEQQKQ
jgi:hypothetical protein